MANNTRRKGFSILSFLLGIIFGMIILVASVAGVAFYVLKTDVDSALKLAGLENKDEEGNSIYINTDIESGGVANLLDLVSKVQVMAGKGAELSIGEIEGLLPALSDMVDQMYGAVNSVIPMERDELTGVKFASIGDFVIRKVQEAQPVQILENFGMTDFVENKIMSLLLLGPEADYEQVGESKYPLYYDSFALTDGTYRRSGDNAALPAALETYLTESGEEYRLFYYIVGGDCYVSGTTTDYALYNADGATLSGYYYMNGAERVIVTPITIKDFSSGNFDVLNDIYLSEFFGEGTDLFIFDDVLSGVSVGDLMNGNVNIEQILRDVSVSDLIQTQISDGIMLNMFWNITDVSESAGEDYTHRGVYTANGNDYVCYIRTKTAGDGNAVIDSAYYFDGETKTDITSLTIGDLMNGVNINDKINDFKLSDFIYIKAEESVVAYLGYGIYGIEKTGEGKYTASYDKPEKVTAYITTDAEGVITDCYYLDGDAKVKIKSTSIIEVSGMIAGITQKLTIGDFIGETDDPILSKLCKYTINNVSDGLGELTLTDVLGGISESNVLLYNLKDSTIGELPDAIANLTINTIYASEIYKISAKNDDAGNEISPEVPAELKLAQIYNEKYIYYTLNDGKYTLVNVNPAALGKLEESQFTENTYYTYGEAQGIWKMLLYKDGSEAAYTINNLTDMIGNVSDNMSKATLRDLHNSGILVFSEPSALEKSINYNEQTVKLGDLGLLDFMNYSLSILTVM